MMHSEKTLDESLRSKAEVAYLCVELAFFELNFCAKAGNVYLCSCVEYNLFSQIVFVVAENSQPALGVLPIPKQGGKKFVSISA
jgi:hypothetical protein